MPKKQKTEEIQKLEQQIAELTDALQRERADVINVRRRHEEQIGQLKDLVKSQITAELLPVIDNFERALKHTPKELEGNDYIKGVNGIVKQFETTLEKLGVERIKTIGEVFNPELHEAVGMEDGDGNSEVVIEELQAGYKIGNDVIRHAMVKVKRTNTR